MITAGSGERPRHQIGHRQPQQHDATFEGRSDEWCKASNCRRAGLSTGAESIRPRQAGSASMRGMMANCEIKVSASIRQTRIFRAAKTCALPVQNRL